MLGETDLGVIAYENPEAMAACPYALDPTETGASGLLLLFDFEVPADGRLPLKMLDAKGDTYSGLIDVMSGAVTFAALEL